MSSNGNTQLIFTLQGDQNQLVANFGPFLPLQLSGTLQDMLNVIADTEEAVQTAVTAALSPATSTLDLVGYFLGVIVPSQPILKAVTPQSVTLPQGLTGSFAYCDTAPTTAVSCPINRSTAGVTTQIGSVNFAAGYTTGTFTFASDVTTLPGDVIEVLAPPSIDATFAGPSLGLSCNVSVAAGYVVEKQAAYTPMTLDRNGLIVMNAGDGTVNTLPAGTGTGGGFPNGWRTGFLNISPSVLTLAVQSGASLNGVLNGTIALVHGQSAELWTDGANWFATVGA
ncbi:hypothetical protein AB4Y36_03575 [Paraburkholderia sp. BR10936]|uniref:hypothetical protein n=1 Tax=Paraburkholderia sp. BR10936 TaxID=3236993 RepID=UPI0034D25CA8